MPVIVLRADFNGSYVAASDTESAVAKGGKLREWFPRCDVDTEEFNALSPNGFTKLERKAKGSALYRREKTLVFDTTNICRQLLDGKLFVIEAGKGTGKARMFAGTAFEGAVGERAIEMLIDGEPAVEVGECCLFGGLPKTDALAFNALYEQLASQARNAFCVTGVQKSTKNEGKQ